MPPATTRKGHPHKQFALLLLAVLIGCCVVSTSAQTYPAKTVRVVVPFAPGGGIDLMARIVSQKLQEDLGQPFIVDNRPGAGGVVGSEVVATARPDGYTLLAVPIGHAANVSLTKLSFDPVGDFAPIIHVASAPNVVLVHPSLKNLRRTARNPWAEHRRNSRTTSSMKFQNGQAWSSTRTCGLIEK